VNADSETTSVDHVVVRRALANADPATLQLHFDLAVLDRYRGAAGYTLIRTDTVGRLSRGREWSIDFGIAPDETALHCAIADLLNLPEAEREHWALHALLLPASKMYLQMRLTPSSCFDDGEVRPWD
jgi:hypothetical protein